jgi:hypothetical protein
MKFNKWTLGLAAVGAVSLASAVRADEAPKLVPLNTALSSTTISGYVDVAAQYNMGNYSTGSGVPTGLPGGKVDNFSFNNVDIALDKPEDETPWASGYHIELNAGTDAVGLLANGSQAAGASGTAAFAVRQGYVALRTPVGNGIDWKIGIQDDIIGYEGNTDGANPNYTRSVGYSVEPTTLLGMIGSYKITDAVTVQFGIADATSPGGPATFLRGPNSSDKTFAGAVTFTAPDSFGFAKGATLTLATLQNIATDGQDNYYAGVTLPTPMSTLKVGASFDLVDVKNSAPGNPNNDSGWVIGLYGSLTPTDKLSFNLRGEYYDLTGGTLDPYFGPAGHAPNGRGEELTATVAYALWANVTSRLEFRWDHIDQGEAFANAHADADAFVLAANIIYTF